MKLSDVMGATGLSGYAEVALVVFFIVFLCIFAWVFARRNRQSWERARGLPLDDGARARDESDEGVTARPGGHDR